MDMNLECPVLMLTAHSSVELAVDAMSRGAFHYITKPFHLKDLMMSVERALEMTSLRRRLRTMQAAGRQEIDNIIGETPQMKAIKDLLQRFASSPSSTILVTGESGTGKELAAKAIHGCSDRRGRPFLTILCSALPPTLLETKLFGHESGAFTDARTRKLGLLEQAPGGTVFLDEVGELESSIQSKLLRFLEQKTFRRVGGSRHIAADVRIIAATNVDLQAEVQAGTFRADLYYRLAVLTAHMPPLRQRRGDIELLAESFQQNFCREFNRKLRPLSDDIRRWLTGCAWPGNVRELRNVMERAVLLCAGQKLEMSDLSAPGFPGELENEIVLPREGLNFGELERSLVRQALERTGGNQTRAAELLGMKRDQIRYRIKSFGLSPASGSLRETGPH